MAVVGPPERGGPGGVIRKGRYSVTHGTDIGVREGGDLLIAEFPSSEFRRDLILRQRPAGRFIGNSCLKQSRHDDDRQDQQNKPFHIRTAAFRVF